MIDLDSIRAVWLATRSLGEVSRLCGVSLRQAWLVVTHIEREQGR